jgi:hypothetical protein
MSAPVGRHDSLTGAAFWALLAGGAMLLIGEVAAPINIVFVFVIGAGLFVVGVVLAIAGTTMSNRSTGRGWFRSLGVGLRSALRMALDFLP